MVKFGLIINPGSRRMRRNGGLVNIVGLAKEFDIPFAFPDISERFCAEMYRKPLGELLDQNIDVLLVCSGDGGHHLVDTALFSLLPEEQMPMQANLRGGTMNLRAESVGLTRRTLLEIFRYSTSEHLLQRFVETYRDKGLQEIPFSSRRLLRVDTGENQHIGFAYSSGFTVPFFEEYYAMGGNHIDTFRLILRSIAALPFSESFVHRMFEPRRGRISLDGNFLDQEEYRGLLLLSQDVKMYFGIIELNVSQLQGINEGSSLRYLGIESSGSFELVRQVPHIFTGRGSAPGSFALSDLVLRDVCQVTIQGRHPFIVDGDLYSAVDTVEITSTQAMRYAVV